MVDVTIQNQGHIGRFPIVMTTGPHHMQAYWFFTEEESRILNLLPFIYLKTEQRWIPRQSAFLEYSSGLSGVRRQLTNVLLKLPDRKERGRNAVASCTSLYR